MCKNNSSFKCKTLYGYVWINNQHYYFKLLTKTKNIMQIIDIILIGLISGLIISILSNNNDPYA